MLQKAVQPGELILKEKAVIVLTEAELTEEIVGEKFGEICSSRRAGVGSLRCKAGGRGSKRDIFLNNAVRLDSDQFGLFPTIALVNHNCAPGGVWGGAGEDWLELRAVRPLQAGEEVTVNYIGDQSLLLDPAQRSALTLQGWGFQCRCEGCTEDRDADTRRLLAELQRRLRTALCCGRYPALPGLHSQQVRALQRLHCRNQQAELESHQAGVVISLLAAQHPSVTAAGLHTWQAAVARDGLAESKRAWQDMNRSFKVRLGLIFPSC